MSFLDLNFCPPLLVKTLYRYLIPVIEKRKLEPALMFFGMRGISYFGRGRSFFRSLCGEYRRTVFFCNQPNIPRQAIVLKLGIIYLQFAPVAQLG